MNGRVRLRRTPPAGSRTLVRLVSPRARSSKDSAFTRGIVVLARGPFANNGPGFLHRVTRSRAGRRLAAGSHLSSRAHGCDDLRDGIEDDLRTVAHDVVAAASAKTACRC